MKKIGFTIGKYVAEYLNIENVIVDKERKTYDIRAENIRKNIEAYKKYLSNDVYFDIKKARF